MVDAATLGRALAAQRWSGARGEVPENVRLEGTYPLGGSGWALAVLAADVGGRPLRYLLARATEDGATPEVLDSAGDPTFRRALATAMASGGRWTSDDGVLVAIPEHGGAELARLAGDSRVGSAEQSNTSIVYGSAAIVKLFRRLEAGVHPDVEMTRFLSRRGFPHVPALLAVIQIEDAAGQSVAAMAQRLVPGAGDAWAHAVDAARRADPTYVAFARELGRVTRAMHDTLASDDADPAFATERADRTVVAEWIAAARRSVEAGVTLARERAGSHDGLAAIGDADVHGRVLDRIARTVGDDGGRAMRHHGDYHLGQVLRSGGGNLFVIDFEGEPSRPLAVRRAKHSALRDVAGMLRSFAYAAATAGTPEWEQRARSSFLDGYFGDALAPYLPREREATSALLTLFELEKVFYELHYELRNRPDWVAIPLAGIRALALDGRE